MNMKTSNRKPTRAEAAHEAINRMWDADDEVIIKTYAETMSVDASLNALSPRYMRYLGQRWVQNILDAYLREGCNPRTGSRKLSKYVKTIQRKLETENDSDVQR
jgi:hypothetical protein